MSQRSKSSRTTETSRKAERRRAAQHAVEGAQHAVDAAPGEVVAAGREVEDCRENVTCSHTSIRSIFDRFS